MIFGHTRPERLPHRLEVVIVEFTSTEWSQDLFALFAANRRERDRIG
jgi:hypothetical protein